MQACLALAIGFGLALTATQVTLILTVVAALITLLTRQSVWAPANVIEVPAAATPRPAADPPARATEKGWTPFTADTQP